MPPLLTAARGIMNNVCYVALEQEKKDHQLAEELNKKEYEETGQMIECGCCCSEYTFDDMAQCTSFGQHFFFFVQATSVCLSVRS